MHPEIEKLIKLAMADGELTEKKRAIILRKAENLGEDKDEVEMIIDGEMALFSKDLNKNKFINSSLTKEGNIKKCPSCGSPVPSFTLKCADCGHEFRNTESTQSVKEFYNQLKSAKLEEKATIISNFPIPNNKEDLFEFITTSIGNSRKLSIEEQSSYINYGKFPASYKPEYTYKMNEIKCWQGKAESAIMKAKIMFSDNSILLEHLKKLEEQFVANAPLKNKELEKDKKYLFLILLGCLIALIIIMISI
jgi:hypothetical protein